MNWPTSQDYNEAIQNAATTMSDPDLKGGEPTVNAMGLPVPRSGNFADVYEFKGSSGTMWAVKCFTRRVEGLQERYTKINQYLAKAELPFIVGFKFLQQGIRIHGEWHPLLKMEWVEGFTLNEFVRQNADKRNYLHGLMQMWAKLTGKLRDANMAHADLQHGNVLLVPGNTPSKLGLKLIDYDGMWVPPLADYHSGEVGHPNYQHPLRLKERLFNAEVDRFPHLVIACALRATLVGGRAFWDKFDNGDNLLFREQDLREPASAPIFKALWELDDRVVRALAGHIALSSRQPLRKTPWLDDLLFDDGGPALSSAEEKQVVELLGVTMLKAVTVSAASQLTDFTEFTVDDDESETERARSPSRKREQSEKATKSKLPSRKREQPEKATKSKLPLAIGGGVLALALLVGAVVVFIGGKKEQPQPQLTEGDRDDGTSTPKGQNQSKKGDSVNPGTGAAAKKEGPGANIVRAAKLQWATDPDFQPYYSLGFSSDGKLLYSVSRTKVGVWDAVTGKNLNSFARDRVGTACFGPGNTLYLVANGDLQIWDWKTGNMRRSTPRAAVTATGFLPQLLYSAERPEELILPTASNRVVWWDVDKAKVARELVVNSTRPIFRITPYPNGDRWILYGGNNGTAVWDMRANERAVVLEKVPEKFGIVTDISPNGAWIAGVYFLNNQLKVGIWDAETGKLVHQLNNIQSPRWAGFSSDSKYGVVVSQKKRLILNIAQGKFVATWRSPQFSGPIAILAGENVLVSGDNDCRIRLWKMDYEARPGKDVEDWVDEAQAAFRASNQRRLTVIHGEVTRLHPADSEAIRKIEHLQKLLAPAELRSLADISANTASVAVADLKLESSQVGWGIPMRNRILEEGESSCLLEVGGKFFGSGLYAHARSRYVLALDHKWSKFTTKFGLQDGHTGSVVFVIKGDGKELYRSTVVRDHLVREQQLSISNVTQLELIVEDAGDGGTNDWGVWLEPKLLR